MKRVSLFLVSLVVILSACSRVQEQIDLAGKWQIQLDPEDKGINEGWYQSKFADAIHLPGSLQEQGFGFDVDLNTKWTGQVVDRSWYDAPEYEKYRQEGNMKVPFWLNPDKHYVGVAWYQKEIHIPSGWKDKHLFAELERTHWETSLYIDGEKIGEQNALSTPHHYELTGLTPGKHTLTVRVDNRVHIPVGINAHSVSDHTQSNWNGLTGNLRIQAKPVVYIDDVQLYPDIQTKEVRVVSLLKGKPFSGKATLQMQVETPDGKPIGKTTSVELDSFGGEVMALEARVEAGKEALLWTEYQPNVYKLKTTLVTSNGTDEKYTQFGFREFKKNGTRFLVNGQPVFLRGTLECSIFPLTGYPAMENAYWEKIYRTCKEFGLNHVRFHSWCPPEVAFTVADSMGIYLQVECAAWANVGDGEYLDRWLYEEGDRILKEYGNHPSFCLMAYGNEPDGANQVKYLSDLVAYWKEKDTRRVYTSAGGWPYIKNADYWNAPDPRIQGWGEGLRSIINAQTPRSDYDFRHKIREDMPTVSHEIGQWCVYPNLKEIEKYTGVLKAKNFEIFKETLQEKNMGDLSEDFLYASGRLQTLCYKADIEAALRTPGFAGFQLLDLHDFPGQGTALVGVLDPFWDTKGYVNGEEFSMFSGKTVPLVRFPKMVWLNNETMNVPVEFAHFDESPVSNANITWTVIASDNQFIGKESFSKDLPVGNCIPVGNIEVSFEQLNKPTQLTVTVQEETTSAKNEWNIWVYPAEKETVRTLPYITSKLDNAALDKLNKGENVLLISPKGNVRPEKGGNIAVGFSSIFWNTAWTRKQAPHTLGILCNPKHPALASFPTEGYSDFQWWDIVSNADAMILDDFPAGFRPIVHLIDDWFTNRKLGILFETKVGDGKLVVCSVDLLKDMDKKPAASQFRQSILEYMASDNFNPQQEVNIETIKELFN